MTELRLVDDGGDLWPVSGHRCPVCGWPLNPGLVEHGEPTHPCCDPDRTETTP